MSDDKNKSNKKKSQTPDSQLKHVDKSNYTLKDLAEMTGYSKSTISRIFNDPSKVKKTTMVVLNEAIEKLGYQPSRVAQRLRAGQGKAKVIGLIIPDIMNPFFADITKGVEDVAYANGYALILSNSDENIKRQKYALETLRMEAVDGIILPPVHETDDQVKEYLENGIKIVCVDRRVRNVKVDCIVSDNRIGAYNAVKYLINKGHRRIGFIGGISGISTSSERLAGYNDAIQEFGLDNDKNLVKQGDSRQDSGLILTQHLLDLKTPPTAIFTSNNLMTLGALIACSRKNLNIPNDISIIGYDDVPWAEALNPPPTVMAQSGYEIGKMAAEILLSRIQNDHVTTPVTVTIEPELIERHSCKELSANEK